MRTALIIKRSRRRNQLNMSTASITLLLPSRRRRDKLNMRIALIIVVQAIRRRRDKLNKSHSRPQSPSFLDHVVLKIKPNGSGDENEHAHYFNYLGAVK